MEPGSAEPQLGSGNPEAELGLGVPGDDLPQNMLLHLYLKRSNPPLERATRILTAG